MTEQHSALRPKAKNSLPSDPQWYKDAVIYEVHVRAFCDSNGDGIGDFQGLISKLDYIQDLGVTALWILPFYPSPLRDDGYDIASYTEVNNIFGNMDDFKEFLKEAHKRGIRVITELVINHTSDQHEWFQKARRAPAGSPERNFYVWSDTPDRYKDTRIIFEDFETSNWTWDPVAKAYFWHRFYGHQPDLNFENPAVHQALFRVIDFWLKMGVDGMRLDAIPYLFEQEDTNCENLPQTHDFLKKIRSYVDSKYQDRMLLAEANQWPEDAVEYFGEGDECHMNFHFPLMPRMFMSIQMEDRYPIIDILKQTPAIPENCEWAIFLRNHDELTLEMVTDEERDYMYRAYAKDPRARVNLGIRRRLAPLLQNNRRQIELLNGLLFSLPGTPVLYYGDEIAMGDNIYLGDRDAVRTPMQWSPDRNAGFSKANPQQLFLPIIIDPEYHFEAINVEAQQHNSNSMLWWMKRIIALRKQFKALQRGSLEFIESENPKVLTFVRKFEDQSILCVANLSRQAQCVELDLSQYNGSVPTELFGQSEFPPIGDLPYFITLGGHSFYWFHLEEAKTQEEEYQPVKLNLHEQWRPQVEALLPQLLRSYLPFARWFGAKGRKIKSIEVRDCIAINGADLFLIDVDYATGEPDTFVLPLGLAQGERAQWLMDQHPTSVLIQDGDKVICDASGDPSFGDHLLKTLSQRRILKGKGGELRGHSLPAVRTTLKDQPELGAELLGAEQSNTSLVYGQEMVLKLFRRVEGGINPDLEIGEHLSHVDQEVATPQVLGHLQYTPRPKPGIRTVSTQPTTVGVLTQFVKNEGNCWTQALTNLQQFFHKVVEKEEPQGDDMAQELLGPYLSFMYQLGHRTAELHCELAKETTREEFQPVDFSELYQRSLNQSLRNRMRSALALLKQQSTTLSDENQGLARLVLGAQDQINEISRAITQGKLSATRTRIHGDFHLGQVLFTGKDFSIIDFEGEPSRSLTERRLKRSPMKDVAGMLRSFDYAATVALYDQSVREEDRNRLAPWAQFWVEHVSKAYMEGYTKTAQNADFMPKDPAEFSLLLRFFLLEKALYELEYEINNRPQWVGVPLRGLLNLFAGRPRSLFEVSCSQEN